MKEIEVLGSKKYYVSLPDNYEQFFVYVNLVINNRNNQHKPKGAINVRPNRIGPYNVLYTRNEVGELFLVVFSLKEQKFMEMLVSQFSLLRTYWQDIAEYEQYPNASRYDI